jgi:putative ABC transport system ATP-binding protein
MDLFAEINRNGTTVILVTHNREIGQMTKRRVHIRDGKISGEEHSAEQAAELPGDGHV